MQNKFFDIIEHISNAVILTDIEGNVLFANHVAEKLVKQIYDGQLNSIAVIDPDFNPEIIMKNNQARKNILYRNLKLPVNIYSINYDDQHGILYVFEENALTSELINEIINNIDDAIAIVNKDRALEFGNDTALELVGLDRKENIGKKMDTLIDKKIATELLTPEIFKTKKPMSKNVEYSNGKIITYSGVPILDEEGEIKRVILDGRDISELVKLKAELQETKKIKKKYYESMEELKKYREFNKIVYSSELIDRLLNISLRAAKTDSSIFLTGESGVGKEEFAKFIHRNSKREDQPFISINCAAIPSELIESEIFGYEEGSFTGARKGGKKGLFEEANRGTVFLDEIGEMSLQMQSKLLRVLQENSFMRIGGNKSIKIDVRYICATNLTAEQLADKEKFRQDLYYRLRVVPIHIPSLRERRDDIFPLIQHFLKHFNDKYERKINISKKVMMMMFEYNWPGNVRELKNLIERLVVLAEGDMINESEYGIAAELGKMNNGEAKHSGIQVTRLMNLNEAYKILDEMMIRRALKEHDTIIKAAEALGIAPSTIHRKINKGYDIK